MATLMVKMTVLMRGFPATDNAVNTFYYCLTTVKKLTDIKIGEYKDAEC